MANSYHGRLCYCIHCEALILSFLPLLHLLLCCEKESLPKPDCMMEVAGSSALAILSIPSNLMKLPDFVADLHI